MRFINYTIIRFSVCLVLGILAAHFYRVSFFALIPLLAFFILTGVLWILSQRQLIQKVYFGISVYCCFFAIGYFGHQIRDPHFQSAHYWHITNEDQPQLLQIKIKEILKPDLFHDKYYADVIAVDSIACKGKILLTIVKDSLAIPLHPDDVLLVYAPFTTVSKPLNPDQFDYSQYMQNQEVYNQVRITEDAILKVQKGESTLFGRAQNIRSILVDKLKQTNISKDERSIIQGLILGDKKDIDKQLYEKYAAAGAVHILAVSGLHVGILFVILSFLLRPITRLKHGTLIRSILIVIVLWGFAFLAGLSPSVVRSVSMFSFFAFALLLGRRTHGINTLFLSFFFLLIINPLWLFQVGFQLSYAAVFFILWLQPTFHKLGYSKYWLIRKTRGLITVSVSAQLGVLPLTLFYFHQFPGLFLVTNLIVLPTLTLFMGGGILIIGLASFNGLPDWLADGYNYMIEGLNQFISWVASQESFLFSDIQFSILKTMGAYLLIVAIILMLRKWNYSRVVLVLTSISILIGISIYDKSQVSKSELLIFHKSRHTLIGYKNQREFTLFSKDGLIDVFENHPLKSYQIKNDLYKINEAVFPEVFRYGNKTILVLDSLGTLPKNQQIHTVVLTKSPKINLNRLIDSLQPHKIVADGSNYPTFVEQWEQQCRDKGISFHYTGKNGAYLMEPFSLRNQ